MIPKFNPHILEWLDVREGCCVYCGRKMNSTPKHPQKLTVEHFYPKCNGGTNYYLNKLPCCSSCNATKAGNSWKYFLEQVQMQITFANPSTSKNKLKRLHHMAFSIRFIGVLMERFKKEIYSFKEK